MKNGVAGERGRDLIEVGLEVFRPRGLVVVDVGGTSPEATVIDLAAAVGPIPDRLEVARNREQVGLAQPCGRLRQVRRLHDVDVAEDARSIRSGSGQRRRTRCPAVRSRTIRPLERDALRGELVDVRRHDAGVTAERPRKVVEVVDRDEEDIVGGRVRPCIGTRSKRAAAEHGSRPEAGTLEKLTTRPARSTHGNLVAP
jgi:hypothetical protein